MVHNVSRVPSAVKSLILPVILLSMLAMSVEGSVGVAISPAGGSTTVSMDGGKISFYVFNSGTDRSAYKVAFNGEAKNFVSFNETETAFYIDGGGKYKSVEGIVEPDRSVVPGTGYVLEVTVTSRPPEGGVGVGASVSTNFTIIFSGERTKPFVNLPKQEYAGIKPVGKSGSIGAGTIWGIPKLWFAIYSFILLVLLVIAGGFVWKKRGKIARASGTAWEKVVQSIPKVTITMKAKTKRKPARKKMKAAARKKRKPARGK